MQWNSHLGMPHLRYDATNGESVAEIVLELINSTSSFSFPPSLYNPTSSVVYHKPFGAVAIFCVCLFIASFLCFWPCVIIRGFCAQVIAAYKLIFILFNNLSIWITQNRGSAYQDSTSNIFCHVDFRAGVGGLFSKLFLPFSSFSFSQRWR